MFNRYWFALRQGFLYRTLLRQFVVDRKKQIQHLSEITPEGLDKRGIAVLVLDFDGVLAPHGDGIPSPEAVLWLRRLSLAIGEQRLALFTNKPDPRRLQYFMEHFPSLYLVQGVRKKPYPDGLLEIAQYRGLAPHRIALLDDRLFTGMLATCLAHSQGWYFSRPLANYKGRPFKECFFSILRVLERRLFSLIG